MSQTPEQLARQKIDQQLEASGWRVQNYTDMNIAGGPGVAVREFPLASGPADYLLYINRKAAGVIEAKPAGTGLKGVEPQSARYNEGLPASVPNYGLPLPFAYESTGVLTQFTNSCEPDYRSRRVFTFHRPVELAGLLARDEQLRASLRSMPEVTDDTLWKVQRQAIINLEHSLAHNRPRSLIQMATGSGKTFTAVSACYRLIKFAKAHRILFLVDRNNLGKQTLTEFQNYASPYNAYKFTEEYGVQRLTKNTIDPASKVCITTIQRLYSMLKGEPEFDEANEEGSLFETMASLRTEPMPVVYNAGIPIGAFDFIIVDECHRSIYNVWRQVLEYFDAFIIGLTATPSKQTIGFFNQNLVQDYTQTDAVADGVNVDHDIYTISTQITSEGAVLAAEPERLIPHRDKRTKAETYRELDEDRVYAPNELDRDVVARDQIRLVLSTFRDRLFTDIFPGRDTVPKTLIFGKNDQHAEDIVEELRHVFGKGNEFAQKITSKARNPDALLQKFRNDFNPRIAVTVDMIATGTDVKPLECLIFMRNIRSAEYFEQMKGRGCRIIDDDKLQQITPDAETKTRFVIVDAVGVCQSCKTTSKPLDRQPTVSTEKILETIKTGAVSYDIVSTLASRLARLDRKLNEEQQQKIAGAAGGKPVSQLAEDLLKSIDPDEVVSTARERFHVPADAEPSDEQYAEVELERMQTAVQPFFNAELRDSIITIQRSLEQVIDEITQDILLSAKIDTAAKEAAAQTLVTDFRQFIEDHKAELEALQILYSQPYRAGLRYHHARELAEAIHQPPLRTKLQRLWQAFQIVEPDKVHGSGGQQIVDAIALVRHAIQPTEPLVPIGDAVEERYQAWLAEQEQAGATFTPEQRQWLDAIKDHIAASLAIEPDDFEDVPFSQLGGLGRAYALFGDTLTELLEELNARLAA